MPKVKAPIKPAPVPSLTKDRVEIIYTSSAMTILGTDNAKIFNGVPIRSLSIFSAKSDDNHTGKYGKLIMEAIQGYLKQSAHPGATIALLSAEGKEGFYEKYGFSRCPNKAFGEGMCNLQYSAL